MCILKPQSRIIHSKYRHPNHLGLSPEDPHLRYIALRTRITQSPLRLLVILRIYLIGCCALRLAAFIIHAYAYNHHTRMNARVLHF